MTTIRLTLSLSFAALMMLAFTTPALAKQLTLPKTQRQLRGPLAISSAPTIIAGGVSTCRLRAVNALQRRSCLACVSRGGVFPLRRDGRGRCRDLYSPRASRRPHVAPTKMRSARQCLAEIQGKRQRRRCLSCVRWGGIFERRGAGRCELVRREGIGVRRHYHYIGK